MADQQNPEWSDEKMDRILGLLLRTGVLLAALVTLAGGVLYLIGSGTERVPDYAKFPVPAVPHSISSVFDGILKGSGTHWMALGIIILIATPVARVAYSAFAFTLQRDWLYVVVTLIVLALLIYSLFWGTG